MSETGAEGPGGPNRPLLRRLLRYREWLVSGRGFTAREAIEDLEVCERTVYRDIAYLRTLGWDLEFSRGRRRWVLAGECAPLPLVSLREAEVEALLAAEQALIWLGGTRYAAALRAAFEKLTPLLEAPLSAERLPAPPGAGFFHGGAVEIVVLQCSPTAARCLRPRIGAETAVQSELPDGGLILRLQVPVNVGLIRFVLRHGAEVEVLAPASLRRQVMDEHRRALQLYQRESGNGLPRQQSA